VHSGRGKRAGHSAFAGWAWGLLLFNLCGLTSVPLFVASAAAIPPPPVLPRPRLLVSFDRAPHREAVAARR